jgi:hypothetical protein
MNEFLQILLTFTTIVAAIGYTGYWLFKIIYRKRESATGCSGTCSCDKNENRKKLLSEKIRLTN